MKNFIEIMMVFAGLVCAFGTGAFFGGSIGYKQGQVDALSGRNIDYHLVTNDDSSVSWEFIEDE